MTPSCSSLHRLHLDSRDAAALRADLHHAVVLARGLDHLPAFADVVATRASRRRRPCRPGRPRWRQRVPVIRRGDRDGVDRLVVEHLAHVGLGLDFLFAAKVFQSLCEQSLVHIAKRDDVDVRNFGELFVMGPRRGYGCR